MSLDRFHVLIERGIEWNQSDGNCTFQNSRPHNDSYRSCGDNRNWGFFFNCHVRDAISGMAQRITSHIFRRKPWNRAIRPIFVTALGWCGTAKPSTNFP